MPVCGYPYFHSGGYVLVAVCQSVSRITQRNSWMNFQGTRNDELDLRMVCSGVLGIFLNSVDGIRIPENLFILWVGLTGHKVDIKMLKLVMCEELCPRVVERNYFFYNKIFLPS